MSKYTLSYLTVLLMFVGYSTAYAQDKIITINGDTIECKITRISKKSIVFEEISNGIKTEVRTERKSVQSWIINNSKLIGTNLPHNNMESRRWRISINGGMGYRIASTKEFHKDLLNMGFSAPNIDSYFKNLKLGIKASGQIHYMFWDNYGIGIDYQFHQSSGNIIGNIDQGDGVTLVHGEIKNQVYTNFTGLSLYSHYILNNNRVKLYYQISMGLTMYREETTFIYSPMLISGKAFGGNTELGFEYFLTKNFSLGINANLFQSTISNIKVDNGIHYEKIELEKEQQEGLSRLDIGIGIKIYL